MKRLRLSMKKIEKVSLICGIILALLFSLSLYIRVTLPYDSIFGGSFVRFGGNDPWYNMRLVENTLHNFPHRIYFDAFTYYPHGTNVPFAPLFDYLLAVIIWIIGLGNPYATLGEHGIEVIGAWYPAVLGALTVIPVYFIGKELWNRNAGLLSAALIAILPGPFLSRSLLGFTDHDAAGTLFSTIAMLFFILAIKSAKEKEINFYSILEKDWNALKKPMVYSIFGGIFLGCFYLSWVGAPLFIFMLLIYAVVQYVIDHIRGESTDYLCIIAVPVFLISLAMIVPVPHLGSPTGIQVLSLILGIIVFGVLGAVSFLMHYKKIEPYGYPIAVLALGVISFAFLHVLNPSLYSMLTAQLRVLSPAGTALTVGEIHAMYVFSPHTGRITDAEAWKFFTTTFFIAFIAFPVIGYNIARRFRPEEILVIVWTVVMLFACFGQQRFAAYYAVNVAILCGFVSWKIIELVGFWGEGGIGKAREGREEKKVKGKKKGGAGGGNVQKAKAKPKAKTTRKEAKTNTKKIKQYLRAELILTLIIIGFVVFYPPLYTPLYGSLSSARGGGGPENDWYNSLSWLKENTPDPGVDYYELYKEPPINETTGKREDYKYPESAYSVMSWWDYGHWITRIGHRIPFANPFQQGPYKAAEYLIETDESKANEILDELETKYVITDFLMVDFNGASYHPKYVMPTWAGKNPNPWLTIEVRLHMFDGSGTAVETGFIPCLQHYRLVHESSMYLLPFMVIDSKANTMLGWRCSYFGSYPDAKPQADILHGHLFSMPAEAWVEADLDEGVIPEMLKSTFNSMGIPLSEDSSVEKGNENTWIIKDEKKENLFTIEKKEGELKISIYGVKIGDNKKAWTPEYINPVSFVKTFEYVKGARIEGTAPNGSVVEISTDVTTNQGREFVYSQRTTSNGTYEFIVPYSTEGPVEEWTSKGWTNFDVLASPYKLRAGHLENETVVWEVEKQEISVPEAAVMEGKIIRVDLLS